MKASSLIALMLAGLLVSGSVLARPEHGARHDPEARLQNLTLLLDLSDAQQAKLRTLFARHHEQAKARHAQHREAQQGARKEQREAMRAERQQHRETFKQELATVLTPRQMEKFEALMAERLARHERRREMRGQHGHGGDHN